MAALITAITEDEIDRQMAEARAQEGVKFYINTGSEHRETALARITRVKN